MPWIRTPEAADGSHHDEACTSAFPSEGGALALVQTAHSALDKEDETAIAAKVLTLRRGIDALNGVYTELDLAVVRLRMRGRAP
jgi:hypothetical protein